MKLEMKKAAVAMAFCGAFGAAFAVSSAAVAAAGKGSAKSDPLVARGKYVAIIGGCNDCHTPGYASTEGQVPESTWLTGDNLGWRGTWGTTYPVNLRNYMQQLTEAQWVAKAKNLTARPPMPAVNVRQMTDTDLKAFYRYVKLLGPAGNQAPAYVPPDQQPNPPYVSFPSPPPGAGQK